MSHKHGASKSTDLPRCLELSPLDSYTSIHPEVPSCADTCSTCTPTPTEPHGLPPWAPPSPHFFQAHLDRSYESTKNRESNLPDKSPGANDTCLDQINPSLKPCVTDQEKTPFKSFPNKHLQSFLAEQADLHRTPLKCLAPEPRMHEEGVFPHYNLSPAITSVTSLTSHTSLILPGAGQSNSADVHQDRNAAAIHTFGPKKLPCMILLPFLKNAFTMGFCLC